MTKYLGPPTKGELGVDDAGTSHGPNGRKSTPSSESDGCAVSNVPTSNPSSLAGVAVGLGLLLSRRRTNRNGSTARRC
jgi:MYXO-CTERM domain-containing protein